MKRLEAVTVGDDGCLRPDVGKGCFACFEPIWATDWNSDLCAWCEQTVNDAEFQQTADVTGFDLRRYTHTLRWARPRDIGREM